MVELFLHLGYPKTGSSFIQRELFKLRTEVNMINIKWEEIETYPVPILIANFLDAFQSKK